MLRSTWLRLPHERNRPGGCAVVDTARRVGHGGFLGDELVGVKVVFVVIVMLHHFVGLNLIIIEEVLLFLGSAWLAIADLKVQDPKMEILN